MLSRPNNEPDSFSIPAPQAGFFVRVERIDRVGNRDREKSPEVTLHLEGNEIPFLTLPEVELRGGQYGDYFARERVGLDKRIYLLPSVDLLATVPTSNDRVVLYKLAIGPALQKANLDFLFVTSNPPQSVEAGQTLEYQVKVQSKHGDVRYNLDSGPPGMKLSSNGVLSWNVPGTAETADHAVILTIKDGSGQSIFHNFTVAVTGRGDESQAETPTDEVGSAYRQWSDDTGQFRIEARWIMTTESDVVLEKRDGQQVTVPLPRLSKADRQHLTELPKKQRDDK
jgi:hypothetical protein